MKIPFVLYEFVGCAVIRIKNIFELNVFSRSDYSTLMML